MKKIFLILVLTSYTFIAKSQKSYFGVNAGTIIANQREGYAQPLTGTVLGSHSSFFENLITPTFGIFYHYNVSGTLGIRANAQYMSLGYHLDVDPNSFTYVSNPDVTINYFTLPLSIHYLANKHLSLNAGTYVSFTLSGKDWSNQEITKTFHKNDFGFSLGGEYDLYKNFAIGITYFIGAKNIWLNDSGGSYTRTNRALQIALIYKFKKAN